MPATKLIVSDLHMGSGHREGELNPWESFIFDERFAEFLHHHTVGPYRDEDVELILNGDVFDFLQVPVGNRFPLRITERIAVEKLKACMDGHPEVMGALATFLGLWLFAEWPDARVWIGAAIIIASALYVLHRERRAKSRS